jgi:hypothetical protein
MRHCGFNVIRCCTSIVLYCVHPKEKPTVVDMNRKVQMKFDRSLQDWKKFHDDNYFHIPTPRRWKVERAFLD